MKPAYPEAGRLNILSALEFAADAESPGDTDASLYEMVIGVYPIDEANDGRSERGAGDA